MARGTRHHKPPLPRILPVSSEPTFTALAAGPGSMSTTVVHQDLPRYALINDESRLERVTHKTLSGFYDLSPAEIDWRNRQPALARHGYMLRPRYHPGWKPSWEEGNRDAWMHYEDGIAAPVCRSNFNIKGYISQTIAWLYPRRNSSIRWRDRYPQEILS